MTTSNRLIILGDTIDSGSVKGIIQNIIEWNMYDDAMEADKTKFERKAITMIVNSYGGSAYDAWALIGAMEMSATPIITICLGSAMSAAFAIYLAGHVRLAHRFSTFMYHEVRGWNTGTIQDQKDNLKESERLQRIYDDLILSKTSILEDKLRSVCEKKEDWFITAEEAVRLGIASEVIVEPVNWA